MLRNLCIFLLFVISGFDSVYAQGYTRELPCGNQKLRVVVAPDIPLNDTLSYALRRFIGPRKDKDINLLTNTAPWPAEMPVVITSDSLCALAQEMDGLRKYRLIEMHVDRHEHFSKDGVMLSFVYKRGGPK